MLVICFLLQADIYIVDEPLWALTHRLSWTFKAVETGKKPRGRGFNVHPCAGYSRKGLRFFHIDVRRPALDEREPHTNPADLWATQGVLLECFNKILECSQ